MRTYRNLIQTGFLILAVTCTLLVASTHARNVSNLDIHLIKKEIEQSDNTRERVIQLSRDIISTSKLIIYAVHRRDMKKAESKLKDIKSQIVKLNKINGSYDVNINDVAVQEYVEAAAYLHFVKTRSLITKKQLGVGSANYLMGVCDLTGELGRRAVDQTIHKNFDDVLAIKELVTLIYGQFLELNLRNGELRKKSDAIKWNLKKIEDVVYDAKMKGMIA